jgi:hypothetical protein
MTGEIQAKVQKDIEGKSESEASARAMGEVARLKSVRVLNREERDDETVVLTAEFDDNKRTEVNRLLMKKIGNDWKLSGHL